MNERDIKQELQAKIENGTLASVAKEIKVSISYLHDVVRGRRKPGPKILRAMRVERKVEYVRA